jgi:D-inositol-3-phosphate glycosyltransferase
MKIAIIGPAHPLRGGIANFNEALALSLIQSGHEVEIFSFSMQYPKFLFPGQSQFTDAPPPKDLKIHSVINSISPVSWRKTSKLIRDFAPDLVVVRFWLPFMGPALGSICGKLKKSGLPVIAITDNVIPHESRPGDKMLTKYFLKRCSAFMVMARSVEEDLRIFVPDAKVAFNPHPVYNIFGDAVNKDEAKQKLNLSPDRKYVLFFGLIRKYKGLSLTLDAFAKVSQTFKDVDLIVAGEFYEDSKPYYEQIEKLGISDRVILHGNYIAEDQVKYYFSASDLLVQTYLSATQSGVTQIGYHFGLPMLVTRVGGLPEMIEDTKTGYVCDTNAGAVAAAMVDYFSQNREAEMREAVKKAAPQFDWQCFVEKLLKLAEDLP